MAIKKIKTAKVKQGDRYSDEIPFGVDAINVDLKNGKDLETTMVFYQDSQDTDIEVETPHDSSTNVIIEDNLTSYSSIHSLSANQGRILNTTKLNKQDVSVVPLENDKGQRVTIGDISFEINQASTLPDHPETGTADYNTLNNLPSINHMTLKGNKSSSDLGLVGRAEYIDKVTQLNQTLAENYIQRQDAPWINSTKPTYTKSEIGLDQVENLSPDGILNRLTAQNVLSALEQGDSAILTSKNLPNINLLTNGDFQVWQRLNWSKGKDEMGGNRYGDLSNSSMSILSPKGLVYIADRWCTNEKNIIFTKTNTGLKASKQTLLIQYLPYKLARSQQYTLSASVNNWIESFTFTVNGIFQHNGRFQYITDKENEKASSGIGISITSTETLNWVKLEKGDTATRFEAKTYSEEWLECSRYYYPLKNKFFTPTQIKNSEVWGFTILPAPMVRQPKEQLWDRIDLTNETVNGIALRDFSGERPISTKGTVGGNITIPPNNVYVVGVQYNDYSLKNSDPYFSLIGELDAELY